LGRDIVTNGSVKVGIIGGNNAVKCYEFARTYFGNGKCPRGGKHIYLFKS
jgi:hypothetical protein